jgi:hypothetical protein
LQNATGLIAETRWQRLTDDRFAAAAAKVFGWLN